MIEHYVLIKQLHIGAVMASGALFFVRGAFVQAGATWPMIAPLRYLSYAIDTVLLSAAIPLLLMLPSGALANGWLLAKLSLLVAYIVIGSIAFKRGTDAHRAPHRLRQRSPRLSIHVRHCENPRSAGTAALFPRQFSLARINEIGDAHRGRCRWARDAGMVLHPPGVKLATSVRIALRARDAAEVNSLCACQLVPTIDEAHRSVDHSPRRGFAARRRRFARIALTPNAG